MKTWDDWSDFELSKAVAKIVAHDGKVEVGNSVVHIHQYHNGVCIGWKTFDINSWADMGPVTEKHHISLMQPDEDDDRWNAIHWCDGGECMYDEYHKNPLRAAAIVFLMMNGVKP